MGFEKKEVNDSSTLKHDEHGFSAKCAGGDTEHQDLRVAAVNVIDMLSEISLDTSVVADNKSKINSGRTSTLSIDAENDSVPTKKWGEGERVQEFSLETIERPQSMAADLKDVAKTAAVEEMIKQFIVLSERQLAKVQIIPAKIIRKLPEISVEHLELISRRLARSIVIDRTNVVMNSVDCDLNANFLHHYTLNLFKYEPMSRAKMAYEWFIDNGFMIMFDVELARKQHLIAGIDDAIRQGRETTLHLHSVKAGYTVSDLCERFPAHNKGRFTELMTYANVHRTRGNSCRVMEDDMKMLFGQSLQHHLSQGKTPLEAEILAFYSVSAYDVSKNNEAPQYSIASYVNSISERS